MYSVFLIHSGISFALKCSTREGLRSGEGHRGSSIRTSVHVVRGVNRTTGRRRKKGGIRVGVNGEKWEKWKG